jgi:hypothetical protein
MSQELFFRRGNLRNVTDDPWTTFTMDLRKPAPIPAAFDFTRFLVSSITFMVHLREVSVYFDDNRLVYLTKDAKNPKRLIIPQGLKSSGAMGIMNVKELKSTRKWYIHRMLRPALTIPALYSPPY